VIWFRGIGLSQYGWAALTPCHTKDVWFPQTPRQQHLCLHFFVEFELCRLTVSYAEPIKLLIILQYMCHMWLFENIIMCLILCYLEREMYTLIVLSHCQGLAVLLALAFWYQVNIPILEIYSVLRESSGVTE